MVGFMSFSYRERVYYQGKLSRSEKLGLGCLYLDMNRIIIVEISVFCCRIIYSHPILSRLCHDRRASR